MTPINASNRLVLALDVATIDEARELVHQLDGTVSFFKIGLELYAACGLELAKELVSSGKQVFLDLKYFDVPETVKRAVNRVASLGATFLTIHGNSEIIKAAVEGRGNSNLKLLSVTVLTSLDEADIHELGFPCTIADLVTYRAVKALEAGCDGVITSAKEAERVRDLARLKSNNKFLVVTPGIRPAGTSQHDQKRLATPAAAINAGADYLVVGRPIRDAADRRQAAQAIIAEMQAAFDEVTSAFPAPHS